MHSFFKHARRQRNFLFAMLLFGVCVHARAGTLAISGQAPTSVVAGQVYYFQPTISGDYSRYAHFYVSNKPAWLYFSRSSGKFYGRPTESDVGTYSNITVTAYTWRQRASLPAFSITVKTSKPVAAPAPTPAPAPAPAPAPTNTPPVISGTPAITGTVGQIYSFAPQASDANGDPLTFSVANKPSWATFNTATGAMTGTPSTASQYSNIMISASDGKATAALAAFNVTISPVVLGSATVSWVPPSTNIDGTPLTDLAGFRVLYGTDPNVLTQKLELPSPTFTSVEITDLAPGTYYFIVKAYTATTAESDASSMAWKTIM